MTRPTGRDRAGRPDGEKGLSDLELLVTIDPEAINHDINGFNGMGTPTQWPCMHRPPI